MKYETNQHVLQNLHAAVDSLSNSSFLCVISQGTEWVFRNTSEQHLSHRVVEISHAPYNTFAANNGRYAIAVPDVLETPDVRVLRSALVHEWVGAHVPMYCLAPLVSRVRDLIPGSVAVPASGSISRVFVSIPKLAGWSPSGHPVHWLSGVSGSSEKVWADSIVRPAVLEIPASDGRDVDTPELIVFDYGQPVPEWVPEWPVVGGIDGPYMYPWEAERCMHSLAACMCRVEHSNETFPAIVAKLRTFECGTAVSIGEDAFVVPPGSNMIALFHGPLVQWKS